MPFPVVDEAERHIFDPDLPPGNPSDVQPYPTVFRLDSDEFSFTWPDSRIFNDLGIRGHSVKGWNRIFNQFVQKKHMISCSSPLLMPFEDMEYNHYHFRSFDDVNLEYRKARRAAGGRGIYDQYESVGDSSSIDTMLALGLITRSPRKAALYVRAMPTLPAKFYLPQALCYMVLCLAMIKAHVSQELDFKYRVEIIGAFCQSLRYLVYGNEMFGTSFGFLAYGPCFRRSLIVDGSLYMDLSPVTGDGTRASIIQEMTLFDLILHGMQEPMNPMDLGSTLRPESTTTSDDGYAFVSHLRAMGQSWLQDMNAGERMTFEEMRLGGTFAKVDGFSLGSLSRACCEVETHLRNTYDRLQLEKVEPYEYRDETAHTGPEAEPLSTSAPQDLQVGPDGSIVPPDTDDDDMRQRILDKASKGTYLTSLRRADQPNPFPGMSEDNKAVLTSIALAAREGGVDIRGALEEIGG